MPEDTDKPADDSGFDADLDRALDGGFAAAGDESEQDDSVQSPSVLGRIAELTGDTPKVSLREPAPTGNTPLLKPLGPGDDAVRGKYMVQGELGKGGVGAVHKGHDTDLGRDVAMKFLHDRYKDEPAVLHRFVEEAQIGGQLQHPGIVPVYDLGMSDGRPFFTMKLVKGETLARQLGDREAVTDDRRRLLSVFEDVCQTMAYAHARGVVHRDLKPANIMVGAFGEVQVVDWGMGKVLASGGVADEKRAADKQSAMSVIETVRSQGHGTQSLMGSVMGTPAYMPPEQARGDVEAMDERSDVFALGAILCEILTGLPPYVGELEELIGMAAMAQLDDAKARLSGCGAEQDLVDLATRCLMPAPAARPKSAEAVAQAVHDHLAAVEARVHDARVEAAEAKVRATALTRQRTLGLALTTAVAAGLVVSLWFWFDADEQRALAVQAAKDEKIAAELAEERRIEAERQRDQVERIAEFMSETLAGAGPRVALGRDTTLLREMMDAAAERIAGGELTASPEAELRLRATIGGTYQELAAYDEAERMFAPALQLARQLHVGDHEVVATAAENLARVHRARDEFGLAEQLIGESLAMRRRIYRGDHELVVRSIDCLARLVGSQGDPTRSAELHREAVQMAERSFGKQDPRYAQYLAHWADALWTLGDQDSAEVHLRESLAIHRRHFPGDHPTVGSALANLGKLLTQQGQLDEADKLLREALAIDRRVYPSGHPHTAITLDSLAALLVIRGELEKAETCVREALAIRRRVFPGDGTHVVTSLGLLAQMLVLRGRPAEAEPLQRESLAMARRLLEGDHRQIALEMARLGHILRLHGDLAESEQVYRESLAMSRRLYRGDHPDVAGMMNDLALVVGDRGDVAAGESLLRESLAMKRRLHGRDDQGVAVTLINLGSALQSQGDLDAAEDAYREAYGLMSRIATGDHPYLANCALLWGQLLLQRGDARAAEPLLREALALRQRVYESGHELIRAAKAAHDSAMAQLGRSDGSSTPAGGKHDDAPGDLVARARQLLDPSDGESDRDPKQALVLAEQVVEATRAVKCGPLQVLAEALFANGKPDEAKSKMQRAMRAWHSTRSAEKKELGERDLKWMQQRLREYGK